MNRLNFFPRDFASHVFLFAGLALSIYFSYNAVYGERSYTYLEQLNVTFSHKTKELEDIKKQRESLEQDVILMRPETLSLDLLEERARIVLGYKKPNEYIIFRN